VWRAEEITRTSILSGSNEKSGNFAKSFSGSGCIIEWLSVVRKDERKKRKWFRAVQS
jgi:hypothetical protein